MSALPVGALVAVRGNESGQIIMIGRIIEDHGDTLTVQSDEEIEGDAAVEYDFHTLPSRTLKVERNRVLLITERGEILH
jgi:hypothetical protein